MSDWYSVRCVFEFSSLKSENGDKLFEERITMWNVSSIDEAISMAEAEAQVYASENDCIYLNFAQAYDMPSSPDSGAEVFSLIRSDVLDGDDYVDRYFDTGGERQRKSE